MTTSRAHGFTRRSFIRDSAVLAVATSLATGADAATKPLAGVTNRQQDADLRIAELRVLNEKPDC